MRTAATIDKIASLLVGLTLFLAAFLFFNGEPMIGKMVLPFLGGAPSVWTTCILFFQAVLVVGYSYAHFIEKISGLKAQMIGHFALVLVAMAVLPIHFSAPIDPRAAAEHPGSWLLLRLIAAAAVPFGVVGATAPLLQNWLSKTSSATGRDPYFLYVASNAGSLLALLSYPLIVEPRLGLSSQSEMWFIGYAVLLFSIGLASVLVWKSAVDR